MLTTNFLLFTIFDVCGKPFECSCVIIVLLLKKHCAVIKEICCYQTLEITLF